MYNVYVERKGKNACSRGYFSLRGGHASFSFFTLSLSLSSPSSGYIRTREISRILHWRTYITNEWCTHPPSAAHVYNTGRRRSYASKSREGAGICGGVSPELGRRAIKSGSRSIWYTRTREREASSSHRSQKEIGKWNRHSAVRAHATVAYTRKAIKG